MAQAARDENDVPTLLAASNVDGTTPVRVYADPVTHRLLVDLPTSGGTVTSVSVATANGFAGTVATATTTPAITISTTVTGILSGNGTAISAATTTGSGSVVLATSPTLVTPTLGVAIATSLNGNTFTTGTYTLTGTAGKTLTFSNSITLAGTDSTTMTFPTTTATIARTDAGQTFTGVQTMTSPSITTSIVTASTTFACFNTVATTLTFGGAATTLTVGGTPTTAVTHNYSTNATANAVTKTVNLGTGGASGSTSNINVGSANGGTLTINAPTTAIGTGSITMTGSIAATGARVTKGWFTDIESTNTPTVGGVALPTASSTTTLTNKRITRRLTTTNAPGATPTTNTDNVDVMNFTGLGVAITSMTTNLSGTPVDGDLLEFRFLDDGSARGITWGTSFASTTVTLPTTTVISTCLRVGFEWRAASSKWECIATC